MSHLVNIQTEVRDAAAIQAACQRLAWSTPQQGTFNLFSGSAVGWAVQLPGWRYPAVCDLATGQVRYDNYGGVWGEQARLEQFLQAYTVEKAKIEARKRGHSVTEQNLSDGSIKVIIQVGGAA